MSSSSVSAVSPTVSATSQLSLYSTCEISDALIKLGVANGGHMLDIYMMSPSPAIATPICGPAHTVRMVLVDNQRGTSPPDAPPPIHPVHWVDAAPAGSVIVVDVPPLAPNAVWGGLMTAGALARGVRGVVISGRCRDVGEHRAAGFPVFARTTSTLGQASFTRVAEVGGPLCIDAPLPPMTMTGAGTGAGADEGAKTRYAGLRRVVVLPGDWIVADENGIVCVPPDMAPRVVEHAHHAREVEARCLADIRAGLGIQASFRKHRGTA